MSENLKLTFDEIDQLAKEVVEEHLLAAVDGDPISVRAINDARLVIKLTSMLRKVPHVSPGDEAILNPRALALRGLAKCGLRQEHASGTRDKRKSL